MVIETALFGIALLVFMATWRWMARPTFLDNARDQLFDLRDDVLRPYFLQRPDGLKSQMYIELRKLINGHLRYTENASFLGFVVMIAWMSKNANAARELETMHESRFKTDDAELAEFAREIRANAAMIMLGYTITTSFFAQMILGFISFGFFLKRCKYHLARLSNRSISMTSALRNVSVRVVSGMAAQAVPGVGSHAAQSALEERAFQASGA